MQPWFASASFSSSDDDSGDRNRGNATQQKVHHYTPFTVFALAKKVGPEEDLHMTSCDFIPDDGIDSARSEEHTS